MINLLPPGLKSEYHYARRNTVLSRWLLIFGASFVGLAVITAGGSWYLQNTVKTYKAQAVTLQQNLDDQKQSEVEKQVTDISNNLKLAVQVLSQEVLFSQLFKQLATLVPKNATLSNLSITQLTGGVDITARTTDYDAATQLQVNLADPANKIFSKADIVSITCATGPNAGHYPCTVTIRALFVKNNPFLFINGKKADS
jgi:Tfp pilus assembly protein PilN